MRRTITWLAAAGGIGLLAGTWGCSDNAYCFDCNDAQEGSGASGPWNSGGTGSTIDPSVGGTGGGTLFTECPGVDLENDPLNCGYCDFVCEIPNAFPKCEEKFCIVDRCAVGFYDIDGDVDNGCEYECQPQLEDGEPITEEEDSCDGEDNDCDGLVDETVDIESDVRHCGACDRACEAPPNGRMACDEGECVFLGCAEDYEDTNQDITPDAIAEGTTDGCECNLTGLELCDLVDNDCDGEIDEGIDTTSDPDNCGACGNVCGELFPHGITSCEDATCVFAGCQEHWYDFDGELLNGCETECDPATPGPELCDGEDNDCDGFVDNDPSDVGDECGESRGECSTGTLACVGGTPTCVGAVEPTPEVCDGLNNDCDEDGADEGCPTAEQPNRLDLSSDPGEYPSTQLSVATTGTTVLAAWLDRRSNADIYFNYSTDSGSTWQDPDLAAVNSSNEEIEPWVFASATSAYLVFGRYSGSNARRINLTSHPLATLATEDWTSRTQVELDPPSGSDSFYGRGIVANQAASSAEDQLVVVWQTLVQSTSSRDIYLQASADGGETWLDENVLVNTRGPRSGGGTDIGRAELPSLATDGHGKVFIAWRDGVTGRPEAWFDVWDFADDGLQGALQLSSDTDTSSTKAPVLAADEEGNVHVLWTELPDDAAKRIRGRSSANGGESFAPGFTVNQPPPGAQPDADTPAIVAREGIAVAVWEDTRAGLPDIYAARYDSEWSTPVKADGGGRGEFRSLEPQVAFGASGRVFVAYRGYRGAGEDGAGGAGGAQGTTAVADQADVYVNFSETADDLLFQPEDLRLDFGDPGTSDSFGQRLATLESSSDGLLVWLDNRDGVNADPYAAVIAF